MAECIAVVKVDAANVRKDPNTSTSIVAIARRDNNLPVSAMSARDSQNMRWFQVTMPNNSVGWIREDLVQLNGDCADLGIATTTPPVEDTPPPDPTPDPTPPPPTEDDDVLVGDCKAVVKVFLARVRSAPNTNGATLGMLKRGTSFTVTEISPEDTDGFNWYEFNHNGQDAWVREDLVEVTGDCIDLNTHQDQPEPTPEPTPEPEPEPEPTPTPIPATECGARVGLATVNVRSLPTTTSSTLGQAKRDEVFVVKEVTAQQPDGFNWVKLDFKGQMGYIRADLVALEGKCQAFTNDDRFNAPVAANISQGFHANHQGLDFPIPVGTAMRLPVAALVVRSHLCSNCLGNPTNYFPKDPAEIKKIFSDANWGFGYGHHMILRLNFADLPPTSQQQVFNAGGTSNDFVFVLYAHLSERNFEVNETVPANTVFGKTGHTGYSSAPHLHLEVGFGKQWGGAKKIHPSILFNVKKA